MNEFCEKLAESLDVLEVQATDVLSSFPTWDSLSVLSTIAMIGSTYGVNLTSLDLKNVRTVTDLWNLTQAKKKV
jgi:acyl carrier protein